ncbi:T9SS type A sorting domain-containing protein [Flavobacterium sp. '19STA2R22 D10 B1']|uniref:T9SS type A sorting domain-containing protein n=1 Tax=Flavobacterium aerium TaxID=3037261 RepID=UPI00278BE0FE|nr:T9SS type A sorting domain-containing protein [Flavobacterium sp. '19STA2R22 D10 B1']
MKKLYTLSLLMVGALSFGQVSDSFTGTGALNANGWGSHSGTAGQLMIVSGSLTYTGMPSTGNKIALVQGNSEDLNKPSAAPITGNAYYSAIVNVPNITGLTANNTTGDYFLTMAATAGTTPNSVTAFSGRLYVKLGSAANTVNFGVLNNSGGTATPSFVATDYPINTPVFIVVKYNLTTNSASLFVNPALATEGTANATNATGTTAAPTQIASIAVRQSGTATIAGTGNIEIDEVKLGGTWAYVTTSTLAVKENAITGLKVYPNPVSNGTLYITSDNNESKEVSIFDILGKQVVKTTVSNDAVNVSNLKGGVYIVKITEDGKTATRKLVVK